MRIMSVCVRVVACEIFYFPCTLKEMSDKAATVGPACQLYLHVCVQCQVT